MMLNEEAVFDAVRRGYDEFRDASPQEICEYFSSLDHDEFVGHVSNIKGIVFEQEVTNALNEAGINAMMFDETNHPDSDIFVLEDSEAIAEFQLKATDSVQYISSTLEDCPDVSIIATSEVASEFSDEGVLDSGLSNEDVTNLVTDVLCTGSADVASDYVSDSVGDWVIDAVSDMVSPIPFFPSPLGWLLGLPFL